MASTNITPTGATGYGYGAATASEDSDVREDALTVFQTLIDLFGEHVSDHGSVSVVVKNSSTGECGAAKCTPELFYRSVQKHVEKTRGTGKMSELGSRVTDRSGYANAIRECMTEEKNIAHKGGEANVFSGLITALGQYGEPTLRLLTASHLKPRY